MFSLFFWKGNIISNGRGADIRTDRGENELRPITSMFYLSIWNNGKATAQTKTGPLSSCISWWSGVHIHSFGCPAILLCSLAITNIIIINWYWHTVCITICICYHYHCIVLSNLCSIDWYSFWNDSYIVSHLVISTVLLYWAPLNIEWWNHQASTSSKINMVDIIIYIICSLV
jgi:hypothetical protein